MNIKEGARRFKARKTPSSEHPAIPPRIESSIDVIFQALDESILERWVESRHDLIVTGQTFYRPGLLAVARVTFETSRWDLYHEREVAKVIPFPALAKMANWDENLIPKWEHSMARMNPEPECFYMYDTAYDFSPSRFEALQENFIGYLITNEVLRLQFNPHLKLYKKVDEPEEAFFSRCLEKIRTGREPEMKTLKDTVQRQMDRLNEKIEREVREVGADALEIESARSVTPQPRKIKTGSSEHSKQMGIRESIETIDDINKELAALKEDREIKREELEASLLHLASEREDDMMRLNRGDIRVLRFSLIWLPYTEFVIQEKEQRRMELIQSF
jgi:hypothetical protein